jgi:hypothetical protein
LWHGWHFWWQKYFVAIWFEVACKVFGMFAKIFCGTIIGLVGISGAAGSNIPGNTGFGYWYCYTGSPIIAKLAQH